MAQLGDRLRVDGLDADHVSLTPPLHAESASTVLTVQLEAR
jgi:hypothetical protein